eukprot:COSAG01_NODE_249_length_20357_cov_3.458171_15_plen_94_part_00
MVAPASSFFLVCDAELVGACVVAVRRARGVQVDKDLLKPTARVALDMTTLTIMRLLPREVPHSRTLLWLARVGALRRAARTLLITVCWACCTG